MAALLQQLAGFRGLPLSLSRSSSSRRPNAFGRRGGLPDGLRDGLRDEVFEDDTYYAGRVVETNTKEAERKRSSKLPEEARVEVPLSMGVSFSIQEFLKAVEEEEIYGDVGEMVTGLVYYTDELGAAVEFGGKSEGFLSVEDASILQLNHVAEAGIYPFLQEQFLIIDEDKRKHQYILSLRSLQFDLAWERCRQLQAEDVVVKGKVIGANKGGLTVTVESIRGFVPFSQMSSKLTPEELIGRELPLKFVEVDEEEYRLVLSHRKAMADSQSQLGIGSVVVGTVQSLKPYGAFIDIGGINGLLHVSQISHDRVTDISTVLQPGDTLKVMILSHDRDRGRVSLSTKKLEPTPGDMIRNPEIVFQKADEMAQTFRQRIAQAEAMARADMLRFQPESGLSLSSDGILGPLTSPPSTDDFDLSDIPLAKDG